MVAVAAGVAALVLALIGEFAALPACPTAVVAVLWARYALRTNASLRQRREGL